MNKINNYNKIDKEDALDILNRTIEFVKNCDSKATGVLGIFGVLLTILFSSDGVKDLKGVIKAAINSGTSCGILYIFFLACAGVGLAFGIAKLLQVLFPKIECTELQQENLELDSKIFFGHICKNPTYVIYKDKMMKLDEEEYLNDIISQIYLNSLICDRKYKNFKIGVIVALIGFLSFLVFWGIGKTIY